jgi:PAS domain-containing protein
MKPEQREFEQDAPARRVAPAFPAGLLRLVKSAPERAAIAAGQVDAIVDPASGNVFLLPDAQRALHERQSRLGALLALAADWLWEQDEHYLFTSHTGVGTRSPEPCAAITLGKPLWELGWVVGPGIDWDTHRQQLEWRATFRDLEVGWTDCAQEMRWISIDGEPVFDALDRFKGYRGTMRDITTRERVRLLARTALNTDAPV